ncbi:hypothetical protein HK100_011214 [Physocladia obscura]|uniref:SH3 domain-containing protein n=1 Tax=Physocladia obscura TaxID=109957 RepID=A0AAD5XGR7_9FUNG|nr:hypothetical protein HK100_011214 [Physocladia obscura]
MSREKPRSTSFPFSLTLPQDYPSTVILQESDVSLGKYVLTGVSTIIFVIVKINTPHHGVEPILHARELIVHPLLPIPDLFNSDALVAKFRVSEINARIKFHKFYNLITSNELSNESSKRNVISLNISNWDFRIMLLSASCTWKEIVQITSDPKSPKKVSERITYYESIEISRTRSDRRIPFNEVGFSHDFNIPLEINPSFTSELFCVRHQFTMKIRFAVDGIEENAMEYDFLVAEKDYPVFAYFGRNIVSTAQSDDFPNFEPNSNYYSPIHGIAPEINPNDDENGAAKIMWKSFININARRKNKEDSENIGTNDDYSSEGQMKWIPRLSNDAAVIAAALISAGSDPAEFIPDNIMSKSLTQPFPSLARDNLEFSGSSSFTSESAPPPEANVLNSSQLKKKGVFKLLAEKLKPTIVREIIGIRNTTIQQNKQPTLMASSAVVETTSTATPELSVVGVLDSSVESKFSVIRAYSSSTVAAISQPTKQPSAPKFSVIRSYPASSNLPISNQKSSESKTSVIPADLTTAPTTIVDINTSPKNMSSELNFSAKTSSTFSFTTTTILSSSEIIPGATISRNSEGGNVGGSGQIFTTQLDQSAELKDSIYFSKYAGSRSRNLTWTGDQTAESLPSFSLNPHTITSESDSFNSSSSSSNRNIVTNQQENDKSGRPIGDTIQGKSFRVVEAGVAVEDVFYPGILGRDFLECQIGDVVTVTDDFPNTGNNDFSPLSPMRLIWGQNERTYQTGTETKLPRKVPKTSVSDPINPAQPLSVTVWTQINNTAVLEDGIQQQQNFVVDSPTPKDILQESEALAVVAKIQVSETAALHNSSRSSSNVIPNSKGLTIGPDDNGDRDEIALHDHIVVRKNNDLLEVLSGDRVTFNLNFRDGDFVYGYDLRTKKEGYFPVTILGPRYGGNLEEDLVVGSSEFSGKTEISP